METAVTIRCLIMSKSHEDQRAFILCLNCGEIMTGTVTKNGELIPVGVDNDGICGKADFEVITVQNPVDNPPKSV